MQFGHGGELVASGLPACINVPLDEKGMAKTGASTPYIV